MENRRDERRELKYPVIGKAGIYKFQKQYISGKSALIHVENFSLKGLRLSSSLDFPVMTGLILSIEFQLFGIENRILGSIVWQRKNKNEFTYGFEILSANMGYIQSIASLTKPVHKITKVAQ
ncbi:PilZ domain-containing protein [Domibacillus sp. A3M-37]|uniref:PilZ domain-containing protein n=1 Tax=Domibacillus sp. A3M-37 TaxID=2962037 RepID=UPI0020B6C46B|nr:PilZ domain-containing protein [Domibacillus sp. A3M-37]MCP3764087.1 PilZ domain-containing protein [Domibacillus sp. A3M-37]